jgi:predicted MFS family arabinose efflux permease
VAARLAQGLGASAIWVGGLTMAADLSPDKAMGRSLSWISGAWSLGFVLGPALGGIGTVRTPFIIYALLSAAALAASLVVLPETGRPHTRTTIAGILDVLRRPAVLASGIATFVLAFYYGIIEGFMPLLADRLGVDRVGIGFLFVLAGLPSIFLPRASGWLADHFGDARLVVIGLAYTAAVAAAILPLAHGAPLWIVFVLIGLAEILVYVPAVALLNRGMGRDDRIFATGSHNYAFSAGFFLGPALGGWLIPRAGYVGLFTLLSVTVAAGMLGVVLIRRAMPR